MVENIRSYYDILKDRKTVPPDAGAEQNILNKTLQEAMLSLQPIERQVLSLEFGLVDGNTRTPKQIAEIIGKTKERTRQIKNLALRKLHKKLKKHG